MAFPTSLDDFVNYVDGTTIMEAVTLNNMQLAIEALEVKVGIDNSIVTSSHDYKLANLNTIFFTPADTEYTVNPSNGGVFEDLDISSSIGTNAALVFLQINNSGDSDIKVKPKGFGSSYADTEFIGALGFNFGGSNNFAYGTVIANSSGIIQVAGNNTAQFKIRVLGFVK